MVTVILSHEVANVTEWKKGFDEGESFRLQNGVKTLGVYTAVENTNKVTVITEFPNEEVLNRFLSNPNLKSDMEKAGVISAVEAMTLKSM